MVRVLSGTGNSPGGGVNSASVSNPASGAGSLLSSIWNRATSMTSAAVAAYVLCLSLLNHVKKPNQNTNRIDSRVQVKQATVPDPWTPEHRVG